MKHKTLILLCCLLTSSSLFAQDTTVVKPKESFTTRMMTVQLGYANMNNDVLKQFYTPVSDELSQNYWTIGLTSYSEYKKWITGLSVKGGMTQKVTIRDYNGSTSKYQISSNFGNVLLHLGYSVVSTDRIKLYPILGLGAGRIALEVQSLDNLSSSQLTNPVISGLEYTIFKYMAVFDLGLGFDYLLKAPKCSMDKEMGAVFGIRAGYAQNVGLGNWRHQSGEITDNPGFNSGMFYVKANIGFYAKWSKDMMKNKMGWSK